MNHKKQHRPIEQIPEWTEDMTLQEAWRKASSFLRAQPISQDAERVAEWLLLDILEMERSEWFLRWNEPFPRERWSYLYAWLKRKAAGEPVQYITGEQSFMGLSFQVDADVLIPRPETEILVETALTWGERIEREQDVGNAERVQTPPLTVADIGTGSGAIAISVAKLRPKWRLLATDLSPAALSVARRNARRHQVEQRMTFTQGHLAQPLVDLAMKVDILLSNPPYIPTPDLSGLAREVREYEPTLALDGGDDGLQCYRVMLTQLRQLEYIPRVIGWECGVGQARAIKEMLAAFAPWEDIQIIHDLAGIERHVFAVR